MKPTKYVLPKYVLPKYERRHEALRGKAARWWEEAACEPTEDLLEAGDGLLFFLLLGLLTLALILVFA